MIGGPLSSLAFGRECDASHKMFSAKGFVIGKCAVGSFGYAVVVIADSDIAAMIAAVVAAGNSGDQPTSVTGKRRKEGWIKGTVREPIDEGWRAPLWIKVPLAYPLLSVSP